MGGIFISYRRDDSRHAAGRLVDRLRQTFGRDQLFMDVDAIEPGLDFVKVLAHKIESCDVLIALIGPHWLEASDQSGRRRLDDPSDFVRLEIETALRRNIRVIPVLLDGARLPQEEGLPSGLRPLVRRQAVSVAHERFAADVDGLVRSLVPVVQPAPRESLLVPPNPVEKGVAATAPRGARPGIIIQRIVGVFFIVATILLPITPLFFPMPAASAVLVLSIALASLLAAIVLLMGLRRHER